MTKLTAVELDLLRYLITGQRGSRKPKEPNYEKLRQLGLIERCDQFPYHRATDAGRAYAATHNI